MRRLCIMKLLFFYFYAMNISDYKDEGKNSYSRYASDEDHSPYKGSRSLDDNSDGDGSNDTCQIADKVENSAGQADRIDGCHITDGTPNDGRHPLSEESQSHNGNDFMKGVYVVCRHNGHGAQKPENNGDLPGL